jgi:hypothetical protein
MHKAKKSAPVHYRMRKSKAKIFDKKGYLAISQMPREARFVFRTSKEVTSSAAARIETGLSIPIARPFYDASGTKEYPPMYSDLTDIWLRYRVERVRVKATFFPDTLGTLTYAAVFPYRSVGSTGVPSLDTVRNIPGAKVVAVGGYNQKPIVIQATYSLLDVYKMMQQSAVEDGLYSPEVLAKGTHYWSTLPTYDVFAICRLYSNDPAGSTFGGTISVTADWDTELSGLQPFPESTSF